MFNKIKEIFFGKPVVAEAPYKVETPPVVEVAVVESPVTVLIAEGAGKVEVSTAEVKTTAVKKAAPIKRAAKAKTPRSKKT